MVLVLSKNKKAPAVRTVAEVAALQAAAMLTTARVGDPTEDDSMAAARPALARINALGFVTVDSQMGVKEPTMWQRAYIVGFVRTADAARLVDELQRVDGLIALAIPHGEDQPPDGEDFAFAFSRMPTLPLTLIDRDCDHLRTVTRQHLAVAEPFASLWSSLLPEIHLRNDRASMDAVRKDATHLFVMDATWGRKTWLFKTVTRILLQVKLIKTCQHPLSCKTLYVSRPRSSRGTTRLCR